MRQLLRAVLAGASVLAALALGTGTSWAGPTAVQWGDGTAFFPYGGNFQATLLGGSFTAQNSLGTTTCTHSTLGGTVAPTGSLSFATADFDTPLCPTPRTPPINWPTHVHPIPPLAGPWPEPWLGSFLTYDPTAGHDFTITLPNFSIQLVYDNSGGITCSYAGSVTGTGYNANNPAAPYGINQAELFLNHASVAKVAASSSASCPGTTAVTGIYQFMGQASAGGPFNRTLRVTL